jgi:hypothetical protein
VDAILIFSDIMDMALNPMESTMAGDTGDTMPHDQNLTQEWAQKEEQQKM